MGGTSKGAPMALFAAQVQVLYFEHSLIPSTEIILLDIYHYINYFVLSNCVGKRSLDIYHFKVLI